MTREKRHPAYPGFRVLDNRGQWRYSPGMDYGQGNAFPVGGLYHPYGSAGGVAGGNKNPHRQGRGKYWWFAVIFSGVLAAAGTIVTIVESIGG